MELDSYILMLKSELIQFMRPFHNPTHKMSEVKQKITR